MTYDADKKAKVFLSSVYNLGITTQMTQAHPFLCTDRILQRMGFWETRYLVAGKKINGGI